jgi:hypothetical protein
MQAGMADILAMLYQLMDRQGPYSDATYIYTNTMHGDVMRRSKMMTTVAESEVLCELAHEGN